MKNRIIALSVSIAFLPISSYAITNQPSPTGNGTTASTQATATVSSSCTIQAQNLSFGNLVLPVASQSASSTMTVLCSKNAPYTVALAYGGVHGSGTGGTGGTQNLVLTGSPGTYNGQGQEVSRTCNYVSSSDTGTIVTTTQAPSPSFLCNMNYTYTAPAGYSYGKLIGVINGDSIGYSIANPSNPAQVWNAGQSDYAGTGTGISQSIPVTGTLLPSQSSSPYPSPDSYMDTVTATVSF